MEPDGSSPAPDPQSVRRDHDRLVIRAVSAADHEAITELVNLPGFRWGTLRLPYQTVEQTRQWLDRPVPGSLSLVAVSDGRLVAQGGLHRHAGRRHHAAGLGLGVHDDYCGRGIGTALLKAIIEAADEWLGLARIELSVFVDNAPGIALYRRHGFEIEGTHRAFAFRGGRFVDAHFMARVRFPPAPCD